MKKFIWVVGAATLFVTLFTGYFAPGIISWYFTPPVAFGVNCTPAVEWGISIYRRTLLCGAGAGFILGLFTALLLSKSRGQRLTIESR